MSDAVAAFGDAYAEAGAERIHFLEGGQGAPLLLVHGAFSSGQEFVSTGFGAQLAKRFRILAPDSLAHGASSAPADPSRYGERARASQLAAVLDVLREPLRKMRRPLTPRRYEAFTRFVASAAGLRDLCTPDKAFDLQLSLRLVPQLRSLSSPDARDGLTELLRAFEAEGYATRLPRTWSALQNVEGTLRPILEIG